ncbi:hypothetical protein XENORESO_001171 [Xenotaenia resolanae]|uniref:Uncharacterized protein n=1 Tax=Xenotaenia resolanae TaxID=208358 RepID=A0ABV0VVR4_9TELE
MRPYSVVEKDGFRGLMKVAEPHHIVVSHKRVSEEVIPNTYKSVKQNVKSKLQSAERVGITSNRWTSVATARKCQVLFILTIKIKVHLYLTNIFKGEILPG